jgi:hypothetical protein
MSTADPNQVPPPKKEASAIAQFLGSFIVDGAAQGGMTVWLAWIFKSFGFQPFDPLLFWIGSVIFYMALHSADALNSGRVLVFHIFLYLMTSVIIWTLI